MGSSKDEVFDSLKDLLGLIDFVIGMEKVVIVLIQVLKNIGLIISTNPLMEKKIHEQW